MEERAEGGGEGGGRAPAAQRLNVLRYVSMEGDGAGLTARSDLKRVHHAERHLPNRASMGGELPNRASMGRSCQIGQVWGREELPYGASVGLGVAMWGKLLGRELPYGAAGTESSLALSSTSLSTAHQWDSVDDWSSSFVSADRVIETSAVSVISRYGARM